MSRKKQVAGAETGEGFAIMQAPEGGTGCSHDGVAYECDADGQVIVPVEAVPDLLSHGFKVL